MVTFIPNHCSTVYLKASGNRHSTSLHEVVKSGNLKGLALLLEDADLDTNVENTEGDTPVAVALNEENAKALHLLLAHPKTDPNLLDSNGCSYLAIAYFKGCDDLMRAILDHPRCDPDIRNASEGSVLYFSVLKGDAKAVELLLKDKRVDPNQEENGNSLLTIAAASSYSEIVELLINDSRIQINSVDGEGETALTIAVQLGLKDVIRLLISHPDLNPNKAGSNGTTPLYYAAEKDFGYAIELLLAHPDIDPNLGSKGKKTPLQLASMLGNRDAVKKLVQHPRINPNIASPFSPMFFAVEKGNVRIVEDLLSIKQTNPNIGRIDRIISPLAVSLLKRHDEVTRRILKDHRINWMSRDLNGDNSLSIALMMSNQEFKSVNQREYPLDYSDPDTDLVKWTNVSFLPVSSDSEHSPPKDFVSDVQVFPNRIVNPKCGEIEIIPTHSSSPTVFMKVVYRTHEFVALSLLRDHKPFGVTVYRPTALSLTTTAKLKDQMASSPHFWHIANGGATLDSSQLRKVLKVLGREKLAVFRALNRDHDPKLLLSGSPLKGRGTSKNVQTQVDRGNTGLVSVSTAPISTFLRDHRVKNGGYAMIWTEKGARLYFGNGVIYPKYHNHQQVLSEVSKAGGSLLQRARKAHEALFVEPVPLDIVVLLNGGFPTESGQSAAKRTSLKAPPRKVLNFLKTKDLEFSKLPDSLKDELCSNRPVSKKKKLILDHMGR